MQNIDRNNFSHAVCYLFAGDELRSKIIDLGIRVYGLGLRRICEFRRAFLGLKRIVKLEGPDIIHTQLFAADIYGRIIGKLLRIPVISTIQSSVCEPNVDYFHSPKRKLLDSFTGRLCNTKFIAVSNFVKESAIKRLHFRREAIEVIYNYLNKDGFSSGVNRDTLRKGLGLNQKDPILITVGKLNPPKGHKYLLEAMPTVIRQFPATKLLIVGDGPEKKELLRLADNLGLGRSILFLGERRDIRELLSLSDIFVFPSLSEGLPLALLEAMQMHKPCLAFNLGPMPEIIEDRKNGILVEPKNPQALAEALLDLMGDLQKALRFGNAAQKYILEKFTAEKNIRELEKLYEDVLNNR